MSYGFNIIVKSARGNFILIQIWKERLLLLRKTVSKCFGMFFTISEISVVLLVVVSLSVWWFSSLPSPSLFFFLSFWSLRHTICLVSWCFISDCDFLHSFKYKEGKEQERSPLKIKVYLGIWNKTTVLYIPFPPPSVLFHMLDDFACSKSLNKTRSRFWVIVAGKSNAGQCCLYCGQMGLWRRVSCLMLSLQSCISFLYKDIGNL